MANTEMKGRREWVQDAATGRWKIRVVLYLFGVENEVFLSNQWYEDKDDALKNYDLIFHSDWIEDALK